MQAVGLDTTPAHLYQLPLLYEMLSVQDPIEEAGRATLDHCAAVLCKPWVAITPENTPVSITLGAGRFLPAPACTRAAPERADV